DEKLSLGLARITGPASEFRGTNIRSPIEQYGAGRRGKKSWGLLTVDGSLYMWLRYAGNAGATTQLAWSNELGNTWKMADCKLNEFGLIGFVNFGRVYQGSRDNYVYAYSHDGP